MRHRRLHGHVFERPGLPAVLAHPDGAANDRLVAERFAATHDLDLIARIE